MLDDIKNSYKQCADNLFPDWKQKSTFELANLYIDSDEKEIKEGAISALIYKYFNQINKQYSKYKNIITEEECYEVFIESLLDTLDKCVWRDVTHKLYNIPSAVEAAINITYQSRMINKYIELNSQKRVLNNQILSIDELKEDYNFEIEDNQQLDKHMATTKLVRDLITNRDYYMAIIVDKIISTNVFALEEIDNDRYVKFCYNKLTNEMHNIDDDYWYDFKHRYDLSDEIINQCKDIVNSIDFNKVRKKIDESISRLRGVVRCYQI